ncbi:LCP family protein [Rathayibacter sp. YIM 133350]|uniref:LCP family protein n=1 Tax=Rathayibacter sp. YIM 133350 TaxID=3131992 RepID=UPI00307D32E9
MSQPSLPSRRSKRVQPIRHGRQPRNHWALSILKATGITLVVALITGTSVGAFALGELNKSVASNAIDISNGAKGATPAPVPHIGAIDGGFNFLLVGTDNDANQGDAYGERDATLNDVNILLHVSADHKSGVVVSIPRDLVVAHPDCTDPTTGKTFDAMSARPFNEAFERGGLGCVVATAQKLTGLDIPYAGTVSFNGVIAMTDAIGGVPVCVNEPIDDPYTGLNLPAGNTTISGATALAFLRNRHGVGDGSDLSRISAQQAYMSSLMRTMKSASTLTDVGKLYSLARAAATNVKLSSNLASLDAMVAMAYALKDVNLDQLVFVQYPGTTGDPDFPGKVMPQRDLAEQLFAAITADKPISLDANALGEGVVSDPSVPAPTDTAAPAPDAPAPTDGATAAPTGTPSTAGPEVIDGLKGQTANTQTCAKANN